MLSLPAKPRFSCKWLGTILKLSADQLLVSNWSQAQVQNFSFSKKLYLVVFNRIAMFILVQWTQPCMNFYVRILKITSGVFNLNRPYKKHLIKVARYSFSRSIPPMFECKLRRRKQRFGKIDTTVVLDKDENLLWSGLQWHRSRHSNEMTPLPILLAAWFLSTGNCSSKIVYWSFFQQ